VAEQILVGIRGYLRRALTRRDGRLMNLAGHVTPLTLYGYAICPSLSLPLPQAWRKVAAEAIDLLARPDCALPTRCFGVMNCAYLSFVTGDTEFQTVARRHVAAELATLTDNLLLSVSGARDISLILRALVYGVRLLDDRAAG
jgi:hypothetical protein